MSNKEELFISVDVETSGPIPGEYSLLQIGACVIENAQESISLYLKPTTQNAVAAALEVTGLDMHSLALNGVEPKEAMKKFKKWITSVVGADSIPVFVGLNASFDWSFINYYFHRYLGENPFGYSALDLKSMYLGAVGGAWAATGARQIAEHYHLSGHGDHDALHDAQYQAALFRLIRGASDRPPARR
jgi:ribonuclease T